MMNQGQTIGILGAMQSEVLGLVEAMSVDETGWTAGFQYWTGSLSGRSIVLARCGMGKVAAAMGVQRLIDQWHVGSVVVCGLAGGLAPGLCIGDIVIGESFVQYDMDASPIIPRFEIPGVGLSRLTANESLVAAAEASAREVARELSASRVSVKMARVASGEEEQAQGASDKAQVRRGLIATGDQFVKDDQRLAIINDFPDALCVEMEGGAIAQVCYLNEVPFIVVRVISDTADGDAPADFLRFVDELAPAYTVRIVRHLLPSLP
jgi:adenosylhomocysteine nucleosidase